MENYSLRFAYRIATVFAAVSALVVYAVLRNKPQEKALCAYTVSEAHKKEARAPGQRAFYRLEGNRKIFIFFAAFLTGVTAFGGMPHIPVLLRERGFDSTTASLSMSLFGIAMTVGKFVYGILADRIGTYKTGYIFSALFISALILSCVCRGGQTLLLLVTIIAFGMGTAQSTVAFSLWAKDFSDSEGYQKFVKNLQAYYIAGGMICGTFPGILADITGSYVPAFFLMSVAAIVTLGLAQYSYKKSETQEAENESFAYKRQSARKGLYIYSSERA